MSAARLVRKHFGWLSMSLWLIALGWLARGDVARAAVEGVTLTPTSISRPVDPGSLNRGSFQLLNEGKSGYDFKVYIKPYHVDGEDYTPDFTLLPGTTDISDWFQFTTLSGHVDPGQAVDVGYVIVVPRNAAPGGYYAVAFVETQPQVTTDRIILNERVGEIFYLDVAGATSEKSQVASWTAGWLQAPPLTANLRLENAGSTHFFADIKLTVRDVFGRVKYGWTGRKVVLPRTIRRVGLSWDQAPPISLYKIDGTVDFLGQTKTLPVRYVLILSDSVRLGLVIMLGLFITTVGLTKARQLILKRRRKI